MELSGKFEKKAQGLPLNTIIIAILVVVVLVIIILIFTGQLAGTTGTLRSCAAQGGECKDSPCGSGETQLERATCPGTQVCCLGYSKSVLND